MSKQLKAVIRIMAFFLLIWFLSFPTGLNAKEPERWSFIVTGDSRGYQNGINEEVVRTLARQIIKENPTLVLFPGDLVNGYVDYEETVQQLLNWRRSFMEPLHKKNIKVYPVRGNHDLVKDEYPERAWNDVFMGKYALPSNGPEGEKNITYSFTNQNAFFIGLDTYIDRSKVNQKWLDKQLKKNSLPHVFLYAHEPAYTLEGGHYDALAIHEKARDTFVESILGAGGIIYFCGHDHWYDHAKIEFQDELWFHQFIVGTAGAPLRVWHSRQYREPDVIQVAHSEKYGYMVVEVDGSSISMEMKVFDENGSIKTVDTFNYKVKK
ncbi:MAG: metallophosphoesterase [Spirochaetes bacterium]|nr:metallophosphoesterase [Spirochaetota bacterium]